MVAALSTLDSPPLTEPELEWVTGPLERLLSPGPLGSLRVADYLRHVNGLASMLEREASSADHVLNLCENRYRFLVLLGAAAARGMPCLLPPSRAPNVVGEMLTRYRGAIAVGDDAFSDGVKLERVPERYVSLPSELPVGSPERLHVPADQLAVIGFTSGSSGPPKPQAKHWGDFCLSTRRNLELLARYCGGQSAHALATVPPQHMYGMETSVLMPLRGDISIHQGRPFFPADIAATLHSLPEPRVLITTPVHLKTLLNSELPLPPISIILSATAPLDQALAARAERTTGARVLEVFGSTETCVIGHRRTAIENDWKRHPEVRLDSDEQGTWVRTPWLREPVLLHDRMQFDDDSSFRLLGRCSDHLEIAGKRASLGEINRRLLALPGVQDAVAFVPD
ncbi:MAG: AMP-binding protein, partial [Gemmataceae bacterium]